MVDITGVSPQLLEALGPYLGRLGKGTMSIQAVIEALSAKLGRDVVLADIVAALDVMAKAGTELAKTALSRTSTVIEAAEAAARRAAQAAAAQGLEAAAVEAAKQQARRTALSQVARQSASVLARGAAGAAAGAEGAAGAATYLGLSLGAWAALAIGIALIAGAGWYWSQGEAPTALSGPSTTRDACPELVYSETRCSWTPADYAVQPCSPGFCWDGGPQGSLACKQANNVPNSKRTYTRDLQCIDGFRPSYDPCTNVILSCDPT